MQLKTIIEPYLSEQQHGFRPNRSITTNLMCQSIMANKAFLLGAQLNEFLGDYKSAFDRVSHRLLVTKLSNFGICPKSAKWLHAFVTEMKYYVQIGSNKSRIYESTSGVIPGSILGLLLFIIFIDDVVNVVLHSTIRLFADDVKLLKIVHNESDTRRLQEDIGRILQWNETNQLYFNKSKCAIFTAYRTSTCIENTYLLDDHAIERVNEVRDLGVLFDKKYSFAHHIEQITSHSRQMIGCIKRTPNGRFTKQTLRILYLSYVKSKLEFASVIWNPHQQVYTDDIESVQKQFVIDMLDSRRNATSYRLAPYSERCAKLRIQPLKVRRSVADTLFALDVYKRKVKDDFTRSEFIEVNRARELRCNRLLKTKCYATDYLMNQPISRLINCVNKFAKSVVELKGRVEIKNEVIRQWTREYEEEERLWL